MMETQFNIKYITSTLLSISETSHKHVASTHSRHLVENGKLRHPLKTMLQLSLGNTTLLLSRCLMGVAIVKKDWPLASVWKLAVLWPN